jgi:hypothetical protein
MYIMYPHQRPFLTVFLFQENKSFGASYHLHSSSDVREVVSRTIYFLWHSGTQAAHAQRDADNGADKKGQRKGKGLKVVLRQHANRRDKTNLGIKEKGLKVVLRQHANCRDKANLGNKAKD